jgi:hypothetical protein
VGEADAVGGGGGVYLQLPWPINRERTRVRAGARLFPAIHMKIFKKRRAPARTRARSRLLGHGSLLCTGYSP